MFTEITDALGRQWSRKAVILLPSLFFLHNTQSFPFQPQSYTGIPISSVLLVLFKILRIAMLPYPPNAALCPCQSSARVEGRWMSFTLANADSGEKCPQAKDILHHRPPTCGPLETFHGCSNVFLPPAHQRCQEMGAGVAFKDRTSESVPTSFARDPWALPRYLYNVLVVCEHSSIHTIPPHNVFAFPEPVISKENRIFWISLVW